LGVSFSARAPAALELTLDGRLPRRQGTGVFDFWNEQVLRLSSGWLRDVTVDDLAPAEEVPDLAVKAPRQGSAGVYADAASLTSGHASLSGQVVILGGMSTDKSQAWADWAASIRAMDPNDVEGIRDHAHGLDEVADAYMRCYTRVTIALAPPRHIEPEKRTRLTMRSIALISNVGLSMVLSMRTAAERLRDAADAIEGSCPQLPEG
jgi:hypothetical protein